MKASTLLLILFSIGVAVGVYFLLIKKPTVKTQTTPAQTTPDLTSTQQTAIQTASYDNQALAAVNNVLGLF